MPALCVLGHHILQERPVHQRSPNPAKIQSGIVLILGRSCADDFSESSAKMTLIRKAALQSDYLVRCIALAQHFLCLGDTLAYDIGVGSEPELGFELAGKVKRAKPNRASQIIQTDVLAQAAFNQLNDPFPLDRAERRTGLTGQTNLCIVPQQVDCDLVAQRINHQTLTHFTAGQFVLKHLKAIEDQGISRRYLIVDFDRLRITAKYRQCRGLNAFVAKIDVPHLDGLRPTPDRLLGPRQQRDRAFADFGALPWSAAGSAHCRR